MLLSKFAVCEKKNLSFMRNQELQNFNIWNDWFKLNKIIDRFLLIGDNFMSELELILLGFTYKASVPFTKNCKRIQKFKSAGNFKHLYRNELDKACLWSWYSIFGC